MSFKLLSSSLFQDSTSYFSSPFCIKFAMCILVQLLLLWLSYLLIRICAEWNTFLLLHILMSSFTQPVRQIVVRAITTVTLHLTLSQSRLQGSKTAVLQVKKRGVLVFRWGHLRAAASAWATQPRQQKKKKKFHWFMSENHYSPYFDDLLVWHKGINHCRMSSASWGPCILMCCCWYF